MTTKSEMKKWNVKKNVNKISRQSEMKEWSEARSLKLNTINVKCTINYLFIERDVIVLLFISFFNFYFLLCQNIMQSWRSFYLMTILSWFLIMMTFFYYFIIRIFVCEVFRSRFVFRSIEDFRNVENCRWSY